MNVVAGEVGRPGPHYKMLRLIYIDIIVLGVIISFLEGHLTC